jgi:hypothetical protein
VHTLEKGQLVRETGGMDAEYSHMVVVVVQFSGISEESLCQQRPWKLRVQLNSITSAMIILLIKSYGNVVDPV